MIKRKSFKVIKIILSLVLILLISIILVYLWGNYRHKEVVLKLGIFSGSVYDVPDWQSYKVLDLAIEKFEITHPGVKVEYRSGILKNDYSEWISQNIIKGTEPDVFCVLPGDFNTFASIGILNKLDDIIKKDGDIHLTELYSNAVKSGQFHGSQYALPKELDPELMFINKTLLQKEGIEIPSENWSWKDFYNICKKVTKDTNGDGRIDQFGTVGFDWKHSVYTNGQQLFDINGDKANFKTEGVLEAINFIIELNKLNQNFKVSNQDFNSGKVAFSPFYFSAYRAYKVYPYRIIRYGQFEWECIKLPKGPKGNNASQLNSLLYGISSRKKHEKEAYEFLKFLVYNKDVQLDIFKYSYGMPALKNVLESPEADREFSKISSGDKLYLDKQSLDDIIEQSIVTPRFHKYEEAMNIADKEIFQLINEGKDVGDTLSKLNNELNKFLKQ